MNNLEQIDKPKNTVLYDYSEIYSNDYEFTSEQKQFMKQKDINSIARNYLNNNKVFFRYFLESYQITKKELFYFMVFYANKVSVKFFIQNRTKNYIRFIKHEYEKMTKLKTKPWRDFLDYSQKRIFFKNKGQEINQSNKSFESFESFEKEITFYSVYKRVIDEIAFDERTYSDIALYSLILENINMNERKALDFMTSKKYGGYLLTEVRAILSKQRYSKKRYEKS